MIPHHTYSFTSNWIVSSALLALSFCIVFYSFGFSVLLPLVLASHCISNDEVMTTYQPSAILCESARSSWLIEIYFICLLVCHDAFQYVHVAFVVTDVRIATHNIPPILLTKPGVGFLLLSLTLILSHPSFFTLILSLDFDLYISVAS
jgi:hypothetical protein